MAPGHREQGPPLFGRESLFRKKLDDLRTTARMAPNSAEGQARTKGYEANAYLEKVATTMHQSDPRDLERLTLLDSLTELYNNNTITRVLRDEIKRSKRYGMPVSVMMLTIDRFRDINAKFGVLASDSVMKGVANFLMNTIRDVDIPSRYDAETFLIICPNTDIEGISVLAERIRSRILHERVSEVGQSWTVTVAIGIASFPANASKVDDLLKQAKTAHTNAAEFRGGNCFVASPTA